jgi:hypothetical protein
MNDGKNKLEAENFLIQIYNEVRRREYQSGMLVTVNEKSVRDIINEPDFPLHYKRAWFLLEKFCEKSWYEYGVTLDLGWLTSEGISHVENLILTRTLGTN